MDRQSNCCVNENIRILLKGEIDKNGEKPEKERQLSNLAMSHSTKIPTQ